MDRLVGADVEVFGVLGLRDVIERRDLGVLFRLSRPDEVRLAVFLGFFVGLVAPGSGDDEVGGIGRRGAEVEWDAGELGGRAALEEDDGVVVGDSEELTQIGFRFLDDEVEFFSPVTHLHDAHAAAAVVVKFLLRLEYDLLGESCWSGREVEDAVRGARRWRRSRDGGRCGRRAADLAGFPLEEEGAR